MDLASLIIGPVVTEKAERLKAEQKTYTILVAPRATKISVKNALELFYNVSVQSVRIVHTHAKHRTIGAGAMMEKRHAAKKALVTLEKDSKPLDLAAFQVISS